MTQTPLTKLMRLLLLALGLGLLMGVVSSGFLTSLNWVTQVHAQQPLLLWGLPFLGILTAYVYARYGKNAHKGNNLIIDSIHQETQVPFRMAILTFIFTISTHLFGGSAGREGTGVQIGGTLAHTLSDQFKLDRNDQRLLIMAGVSAGFASVFGTPLAGAIFGMEVAFIGKFSKEALLPCFISAYVSAWVTHLLGITHTIYTIVSIPPWSLSLFVVTILASILFGLTGRSFAILIHAFKRVFTNIKLDPLLKAFLGGSLVVILMITLQATRFSGLSTWLIQAGFDGEVGLLDPLYKFGFTILTLGSGFQGGEVTPLFGIGASLGGLIGQLTKLEPSLLAAMGLIAVFGCAANAPLTTVFLGIELFGIQAWPFYLMAAVISYLVSGHHGIYSAQVIHRRKHPFGSQVEGKTLHDLHQ